MNPGEIGRPLIILGVVLIVAGVVISFGRGIPLLGRLPGDFRFERGGVTIFIPLATSIVVSVVLTLIFRIFRR